MADFRRFLNLARLLLLLVRGHTGRRKTPRWSTKMSTATFLRRNPSNDTTVEGLMEMIPVLSWALLLVAALASVV